MEWPANPTDLNINENVLGHLDQAVCRGCPQFSSVNLFNNAKFCEWGKIPQESVKKLYATLKKELAKFRCTEENLLVTEKLYEQSS